MPVYEYRCQKGHQYEKVEGFEAPTEQPCLQCGGPARRLLTLPAVIFKGSGFYSTDYRKSGAPAGDGAKAKSDGTAEPGAKADDSEKSEAGAL